MRTIEAFLGRAVPDINMPSININVHPCKRGNAVDDKQRLMLPATPADGFNGLECPHGTSISCRLYRIRVEDG